MEGLWTLHVLHKVVGRQGKLGGGGRMRKMCSLHLNQTTSVRDDRSDMQVSQILYLDGPASVL